MVLTPSVHTHLCRVSVDGPFRPSLYYGDGTPKPAHARSKDRSHYWVVRYMEGKVVRDCRFGSERAARSYFESLPEYN